MTNKQLIEKVNDNYEYLSIMSKDIGHFSWWYSNRSSEDCINVKIHSYVDSDAVVALLSEKEQEQIKLLGIDVSELISNEIYDGYGGILDDARRDLDRAIKNKDKNVLSNVKNIVGAEYCGRSGGWLCVQYDFFNLLGDMEDVIEGNTTKRSELVRICKEIDNAHSIITQTNNEIGEMLRYLEKTIEDPSTYIDTVRCYIESEIQNVAERVQRDASLLSDIAIL